MSAHDPPPRAFFDAACAFCAKSADLAKRRGADVEFAPGAPADTLVLELGGRRFARSDAALRIARRMRWPWSWLGALGLLVPRPMRDAVYDQIARRRHRTRAKAR